MRADGLLARCTLLLVGTALAACLAVGAVLAIVLPGAVPEALRDLQRRDAAAVLGRLDALTAGEDPVRAIAAARGVVGVSVGPPPPDRPVAGTTGTTTPLPAASAGVLATSSRFRSPADLMREAAPGTFAGAATEPTLRWLELVVELRGGRRLTVLIEPVPRLWPPPLPAGPLAAVLVAVILAAALVARRFSRPFGELTRAAEDLAAGAPARALPLHGPRDVRRTQRAFNTMAARLQALLSGRDALLASIGHDLRTRSPRCGCARR